MRFFAPSFFVLVVACNSTPAPKLATFRPSEVSELLSLPAGYSVGETLRESCSPVRPRTAELEAATLASVDCNEARLSRALRARAGELSARFIFGKRCRATRQRIDCSANVVHPGPSVGFAPQRVAPDPGPAPSAGEVRDLDDPRPQDAAQIQVGYAPTALGARGKYAPRRYDAVAETHFPSTGRAQLGQVSARCTGCDPLSLRYALRVTAGHAGAGEVTAVKCFQDGDAQQCVATALAPWSS
jgi:hypothetical protein